ncbi:restriction endonuclease [Streptomyces sp. NPDC059893]|uniref:restriction endonuclease n=1 Tax=Streptomyces sp. NPDC059893 TaxID=3346990 RepID=UPI003656A51F
MSVKQRDKSPGKEFWRKFEEEVERFVRKLGNATVQRDVRIPGQLSGRLRQIDVLATGKVAELPVTVIFEAKCYGGSVQIGTIDELVGKALDVVAQHAVLCAPNGFSQGARARAAGTMTSPLQVGIAELSAPWPGSPAQSADGVSVRPRADRLSRIPDELSRQFPGDQDMVYSVLGRIPGDWAAPAAPAETDDYDRFLRGEAPLFVSR